MQPVRKYHSNLSEGLPPSLDNFAASSSKSSSNIGSYSRPLSGYSPLGAADSGYQTDSPQLSMDAAGTSSGSYEPRAASSFEQRRETPPPGYFRPVSPQLSQPSGLAVGHQRHVATQTFQQLSQQPQPFSQGDQRPFESLQPRQIPSYHSQQSSGFRPASAPLYELPDGSGVGANEINGGLSNGYDAELEDDYDEEVYRSSVPGLMVAQKQCGSTAEKS